MSKGEIIDIETQFRVNKTTRQFRVDFVFKHPGGEGHMYTVPVSLIKVAATKCREYEKNGWIPV